MTDRSNVPTHVHARVEQDRTMNRRDALRRVAVIGGAAVWTAPGVQRLGMLAAHAVSPPPSPPPTSPPPSPPPTSPPVEEFAGISYIGLVFVCSGKTFRAKWEEGNGWGDIGGSNLPQCPEPSGWAGATVYPYPGAIGVSTTYISGELYQVTFTLPSTCTASTGSGVAKGANPTKPQTGGYCVAGAVGSDPRVITFTAQPKP
jgi:hypothetical protein